MVNPYRQDFPILQRQFYNQPFAYLDSAATTQKPQCVIDAVRDYYMHSNANVHRGIYALSEEATRLYEQAREAVAAFIHAKSEREIVFTSGTTESINLVAHAFGALQIRTGDEIIISTMEHHANIVPWQLLCERTGAVLKIIPMDDDGVLDLEAYAAMLNAKTKLVSVVHISNTLGTVNPVKSIIETAQTHGVATLIDGAQTVAHQPVDVQALGCDFYVFSAHKMYGPTGVGVLYARQPWLDKMPPFQAGGDMIRQVSFEHTEFNVAAIPMVRIIGDAPVRAGAVSFTVDDIHPHDISSLLDQAGVAIRAGHHCTMPLMTRLGLPATARASIGLYNTTQDVDQLIQALEKTIALFNGDGES